MAGRISSNEVVIDNPSEAIRNYNKGYFGRMVGETLHLHLIEATFLVEIGRVEVERDGKTVTLNELMDMGIKVHPNFEISYLVFRDLRQRGYVVRIPQDGEDGFDLYPRGGAPHSHSPTYLVKAISERSPFLILRISDWINGIGKRKLMLGIADEEGDLTYYSVKFFRMRGKMKEEESYEGNITVMGDRSMVWDEELSKKLQENFIGRTFEENVVQLSLMETAYLVEKGATAMKGNKKLSLKSFIKYAKKIQPDIERRLYAYKDLRSSGLIPKTGFKFGSHFRVYREHIGEGHAPYLVHVIPENYKSTWTEISRAVRLANSVRKQMIFAIAGSGIDYIRIKRMTP
ncbi:MAG: tRNA-intron lyase [Thermoplasmata archaeon]|nr:MAG: tRNA-intron lyase [Thermoplasmata archaeon]